MSSSYMRSYFSIVYTHASRSAQDIHVHTTGVTIDVHIDTRTRHPLHTRCPSRHATHNQCAAYRHTQQPITTGVHLAACAQHIQTRHPLTRIFLRTRLHTT